MIKISNLQVDLTDITVKTKTLTRARCTGAVCCAAYTPGKANLRKLVLCADKLTHQSYCYVDVKQVYHSRCFGLS